MSRELTIAPFIEPNQSATVSLLPVDQHPAAIYLAGLASGSRPTMSAALDYIAALLQPNATALTLDWSLLRFAHTTAIRALLAERYAPTTANKMLAALRGVLRAAWQLGQISAEDYHRAVAIERVPGIRLPAGRSVAGGELTALFRACVQDAGVGGIRDAAILALLYGCGLRRAELVALDLTHYRKAEQALEVLGKRNKSRLCPVVDGAVRALELWIAARGEEPGALFLRLRKGGHIVPNSRLTTEAIYRLLRERARQAGIAALSPHDLRRTFVGDLLEAGADIATVQKLAGHADVSTTARYDRRGEATKRKAAQLLHVPFLRDE